MVSILLDSSNTDLYVGLLKEDQVMDSAFYECWQMQSEYMIVELDKLLSKNNVSRESIQDIVVSIGPGSYTGVRIAITIAKVMGTALKCKVYPISSLRILAKYDKQCACVINARNGRSFFGVYFEDKVLIEDCIKTNDEVLKYLDDNPVCLLCGDTKYLRKHGFKENPSRQIQFVKPYLKDENPLSLKPVYMKD